MIEQPIVIPGHGSTTLYGIDVVAAATAYQQSDSANDDLESMAVVSSDLATRLGS